MTQRRSQTGLRRAARSLFDPSGLLASTGLVALFAGGQARGQSLAAFASPEETHGLVNLSVGAGLVVFAAITALLHLAGRQRWARRETQLLANIESLRQQAERARAFLAAEIAIRRGLERRPGRARH